MPSFIISLADLPAYGESTARSLPVDGTAPARSYASAVRDAISYLARHAEAADADARGMRYLTDNLYLVRREGGEAVRSFSHAERLRAYKDEAILPALARALLVSGGGVFDEERALAFLTGFQRKTVLTMRELDLLGAALRGAAALLLCAEYKKPLPSEDVISALFAALRELSTADLTPLREKADAVDALFRLDPAGVYSRMDDKSREDYRRALAERARREGIAEHKLARRLLQEAERARDTRARHIGYSLQRSARGGELYISLCVLVPLLASLGVGFVLGKPGAALLLLLPFSQLWKDLADSLLLRCGRPYRLPRLALEDGVPASGKTVCVISMLLTDTESALRGARLLEEYRAASADCGDNLLFGLLCDLPESRTETSERDAELLHDAREAIRALNKKYGGGYYLFTRPRTWCEDTRSFAAWERKRGAVVSLARLLTGRESGLEVCGEVDKLRDVRYILTLDADTRLQPGSARALIGAALHPLNRAEVENGIVVRGHGLIQPRIGVSAESAGKSRFARLFAPLGGLEVYGGACGEVYFDRFQSGGFAGKGILDAEALLACTETRIPENRILSHDAVEGAFLRAGFLNDVELTDGFPTTLRAYFERQHRWIRGDVQNLPFLFRAGRALPPIERWRLFDSLRRAMLPLALFEALLTALLFPGKGTLCAACAALAAVFFRTLAELLTRLRQRPEDVRIKLFSDVNVGAAGAFRSALWRLLLLPYEAWVSLSAMVTALWRMGVSHRKRLLWRTSAQSEAAKNDSLLPLWPLAFAGVLSLAFSPVPLGRAAGIFWLLAPLTSSDLSRPISRKEALSESDRTFLKRRAAEIWRFFRDFCTEEDHFLPPDNYQSSPEPDIAHRTSPTNIGFALLAPLCALELGICTENAALSLSSRLLASCEALPKWQGHFYNWYDTRTLEALPPRYVSAVDSGNLRASLLTAASLWKKRGYPALSTRCRALAEGMDLGLLYDEKRRLFHIGLHTESARFDESRYDLFESEARLTSYCAVAAGQVPLKHWRQLSRAQVSLGRRRGMVSWTGTMFEYLMPELFLPLTENTLLSESARFALCAQRRQRMGEAGFWGMSESAFFSLDAARHYRYKAHGVSALALSRDGHRERVVAPYASFLALRLAPKAAMKNLRALAEYGMLGAYGFWEALDFTPPRADADGSIVRSVMAHHLGMSLAAITNALCHDLLPRAFMDDPVMASHRALLEEKIPLSGALLRRDFDTACERPRRESFAFCREGSGTDFRFPDCAALSNGLYSLVVTESGLSLASCGTLLPYRRAERALSGTRGVSLFLKTDQKRLSLLPEPGGEASFRHRFIAEEARLRGECGAFSWEVSAAVSRRDCGERRTLSLHLPEGFAGGEVYFSLEPLLVPEKDARAQLAFARLGMETEVREGVLIVRRLPRGGRGALYLALASSEDAAFSSDFQVFPTRSGGADFVPGTGAQSEPCITACVCIPAGTRRWEGRFALALADSADAALRSAKTILAETRGFPMAEAAARFLALDERPVQEAMAFLPCLVFPHLAEAARTKPVTEGRDALYRRGLSGDYPLVGAECLSDAALPFCREELARHALLRACGIVYDLLFFTDDEGAYRRERQNALEHTIRMQGQSEYLGVPGGIHFLSLRDDRAELLPLCTLWRGNAGFRLPERSTARRYALPPSTRVPPRSIRHRFAPDGAVVWDTKGALPPRSWSIPLSNSRLGYLATDAGTGGLFFENARECPLTMPGLDALAVHGAETLTFDTPDGAVSFFAAPGQECRVRFAPGVGRWETTHGGGRCVLTAFIPPSHDVRVFLLESSAPCRVRWCAPLRMAGEPEDASSCLITAADGALKASNPRCPRPELTLTARCTESWESVCTDAEAFAAGDAYTELRAAVPALAGSFAFQGGAALFCGTEDIPCTLGEARRLLAETERYWADTLAPFRTEHAEDAWVLYQALVGRLWARTSLYQSGGAYGFRDQLQDYVNLIPADTPACRAHILTCCAHQFTEGDVQHWWHSPRRGVRTRCADDLLWLVWAVTEYVGQTGDLSILEEEAPFLSAAPLTDGENSRYETPDVSPELGTVWEHCKRALSLTEARGVGVHGLPLMLGGDWNDGFDAMGEGAESVWLGFFASCAADGFAALCRRTSRPGAEHWEALASAWGRAANAAWDGDRYVRAYYGNGEALGARGSAVCRMDSLSQSWAAFCPYADTERVETALDTALSELWDREHHLIRLNTPPFTGEGRSPGYVNSYGAGFRENGGQYTHAAVWLALALLRRGRREEARALLLDIRLSAQSDRFLAEPFVVPADVCTAPGLKGRAGWTWYTGAAGWYWRAVRACSSERSPAERLCGEAEKEP